jgi:Ca2+-binding EF-hand superfamily protein
MMAKRWLLLLPTICIAGAALADPPPVQRTAVQARAETMFDKADTNHDGILTREEYHAALAAIAKARGATPTAKGWAAVDAQFDAVDRGHTGRIPRAEFVGAALAHFDGADLNHDGIVTPTESLKAAKRLRAAAKAEAKAAATN